MYIFGKNPTSLTNARLYINPLDSVMKFINHFKVAARINGDSTPLYDNPSATTIGDPQMISYLTTCLNKDPSFVLPEGYKSKTIKSPVVAYTIRCSYCLPSQGKKLALEILDEVFAEVTQGYHLLEPIINYDYKIQVVPAVRYIQHKNADSPDKRFMRPLNKNPKEKKSIYQPISLKDMNTLELKPKISPNLRLLIACSPPKDRNTVKEVCEVVGGHFACC